MRVRMRACTRDRAHTRKRAYTRRCAYTRRYAYALACARPRADFYYGRSALSRTQSLFIPPLPCSGLRSSRPHSSLLTPYGGCAARPVRFCAPRVLARSLYPVNVFTSRVPARDGYAVGTPHAQNQTRRMAVDLLNVLLFARRQNKAMGSNEI